MNEKFIVDYHRMTVAELRYGIKSIIRMLYSHQIRYMKWWRKNENKNSFLSRLILYRYSRKYGLGKYQQRQTLTKVYTLDTFIILL